MAFDPDLRALFRVMLAVALIAAPMTPARANPAFEYRAAGLSIAVDLPAHSNPKPRLSNVVAVSGTKPPERLLVSASPAGRWRVLLNMAVVPGVAPYRSAIGMVSAEKNTRDLAEVPRGGSFAISYRTADGRMGMQLRIGAAGTLQVSYDQPERSHRWQHPGSGMLPVSGIEYIADQPEAVPLPPAAPLLAGALFLLAWRGRRS